MRTLNENVKQTVENGKSVRFILYAEFSRCATIFCHKLYLSTLQFLDVWQIKGKDKRRTNYIMLQKCIIRVRVSIYPWHPYYKVTIESKVSDISTYWKRATVQKLWTLTLLFHSNRNDFNIWIDNLAPWMQFNMTVYTVIRLTYFHSVNVFKVNWKRKAISKRKWPTSSKLFLGYEKIEQKENCFIFPCTMGRKKNFPQTL
jgi:hypothetical protein